MDSHETVTTQDESHDTTDEATEEPATGNADDPAPPATPPRPTRWLIAVFVLVALLVASLVVGGIQLRSVLDYRAVNDRRDAILSVAREVAQLSYSLDYETYPEESAKIVAATTGKYRQGVIDSKPGLQHILSQGKVKSTCTLTAVGIERDDENTATVLFSITARITNTEIKQPEERFYRVAIGLVREGSRWLVNSNDVIA